MNEKYLFALIFRHANLFLTHLIEIDNFLGLEKMNILRIKILCEGFFLMNIFITKKYKKTLLK